MLRRLIRHPSVAFNATLNSNNLYKLLCTTAVLGLLSCRVMYKLLQIFRYSIDCFTKIQAFSKLLSTCRMSHDRATNKRPSQELSVLSKPFIFWTLASFLTQVMTSLLWVGNRRWSCIAPKMSRDVLHRSESILILTSDVDLCKAVFTPWKTSCKGSFVLVC